MVQDAIKKPWPEIASVTIDPSAIDAANSSETVTAQA